jgi:alpha-glucosidase
MFLEIAGRPAADQSGLAFPLNGDFTLRLDALAPWLMRIALVPGEGLAVDRTWMIAPEGEVPWEGRDRLSAEGFEPFAPSVTSAGRTWSVEFGADWRVELQASPLALACQRRSGQGWRAVVADRPTGAYQWFERRGVLRHFQLRGHGERHYGLGDKTGRLDRTGRRLRCLQIDSLGYNAETTDPLYKHAPFLLVASEEGEAAGLLYDTLAEASFDLGAEHSNYHPHYRHVDVQEKGLVLYVIAGPRIADVVPRLAALTGMPAFPPRWSMGFAFTTMHHADAPDAQAVITAFAERCRSEAIPISAIHSGSGYTTGPDGRRYVFTWNSSKFPDRDGFFRRLAELGFATVANVKPVLLTEHPAYAQAAGAGHFIRRADGSPAVEMFWGGPGSSLDFTNPATIAWWKEGVRRQVLEAGFGAVWNDNNECELWDETATLSGFGRPLPAIDLRPLQALLMTRASHEATREWRSEERPFTISRAGPIGIARYGETWSGDNRTSWHTLKWNLRQGLSMSLSGMPYTGHDIGGFDGPRPGLELLVRWMQMMALHPRAVMNSWKPQLADPVTLPWMHGEVLREVREALMLRYRFMPYLYNLAWRCHQKGEPLIVPLFYHFDDSFCREDQDTFMLGADVLVAPAVEEGQRTVRPYLPSAEGGWYDFYTGAHHAGGIWIEAEAPLERLPLFVRAGAILPLATRWPETAPHDFTEAALTLFPGPGTGGSEREIFFDDGRSWAYREGDASLLACEAGWDGARIRLSVRETWSGRGRPPLKLECRDESARPFETEIAL